MGKLRKDSNEARSQMVRDLHARVIAGTIELPEAMKLMRRVSGFNQIDFAKHRGISLTSSPV